MPPRRLMDLRSASGLSAHGGPVTLDEQHHRGFGGVVGVLPDPVSSAPAVSMSLDNLGRTHDKQMFFVRGIERAGPSPWTSHSARLGDSRRRTGVAGIPPIPPVADIGILIDVMHGAVDERVCFMKQVREAPD